MLAYAHDVEAELVTSLEPAMEKLGVRVVSVHHQPNTGVVDITLRLPTWADRQLRHEALEVLARYERDRDHAIVTNPAFVWGDEQIDE